MGKQVYNAEELKTRRKQITSLVKSYYKKFDFLQYDPLDLLIDKSNDLFLDSDLTMDEINEKMMDAITSRKRALDERYDNEKVKANHETIYGRLEQLARLLNQEGVDYQLAGGLCGYVAYGEESNRCHDDIDICINEEDLPKFRRVCKKLGLLFEDNRLNSERVLRNGIPHGEHEVIARDPDSDFHIGAFPFERRDGMVISKGYYHDENDVPHVREEIYLPELAEELFGNLEIDFRGTPLTITPPEFVYLLKQYTRQEKDQHDILFLENHMSRDKLLRIQELSKDQKIVQLVPVEDIPYASLNPYDEDEGELGLMLADEGPRRINEASASEKKEGTKVRVKKAGQEVQQQVQDQEQINEEGFISNTIITTLALISFVLCFIGVAIIYLVQM